MPPVRQTLENQSGMANSRTQRRTPARGRKDSGIGAKGAFFILLLLAGLGILAVILLSDFF